MKKKVLGPKFFDRPPLVVVRALIGKYLCRRVDGKVVALMIVETEAYGGPHDLASHARFGQTLRNASMFGPPGTIYTYFTYGMHWMLNLVCGKKEYPAAVLIRGVSGVSGPGRLTKFLKIDRALNGKMLNKKNGLWIEDRGVHVAPKQIKKTPRIGVDYAGLWAQKPWRFVLKVEKQKRQGRKTGPAS